MPIICMLCLNVLFFGGTVIFVPLFIWTRFTESGKRWLAEEMAKRKK